jgi:hypothetical protein
VAAPEGKKDYRTGIGLRRYQYRENGRRWSLYCVLRGETIPGFESPSIWARKIRGMKTQVRERINLWGVTSFPRTTSTRTRYIVQYSTVLYKPHQELRTYCNMRAWLNSFSSWKEQEPLSLLQTCRTIRKRDFSCVQEVLYNARHVRGRCRSLPLAMRGIICKFAESAKQ